MAYPCKIISSLKVSSINGLSLSTQSLKNLRLQSSSLQNPIPKNPDQRPTLTERRANSPIRLDEIKFPSFENQNFDLRELVQQDMPCQSTAPRRGSEMTAQRPLRWRLLRKQWWKDLLAKAGIRENLGENNGASDIPSGGIVVTMAVTVTSSPAPVKKPGLAGRVWDLVRGGKGSTIVNGNDFEIFPYHKRKKRV
jgi:hypothetical protein